MYKYQKSDVWMYHLELSSMKPSVRGKLREGFNTGMYSWSSWYTLLQLYYVPVLLLGVSVMVVIEGNAEVAKSIFF